MSLDKCNRCGSENVIKSGKGWRKSNDNLELQRPQRFRCKDCGKLFISPNTSEVKQDGNAGTG